MSEFEKSIADNRQKWSSSANLNRDALDAARGIAQYKPDARLKGASELAGEVAARDEICKLYGNGVTEIQVPRRPWGNRAPVLDLLFEAGDGFIIVEAKANNSSFGSSDQ